jgi:hypothetical protein
MTIASIFPYVGNHDLLLLDQLVAPLEEVITEYTRQGRVCSGISDREFARLGVWRTLSQARSGRDFLQQQREVFDTAIQRSSFFDLLHSQRRQGFLAEASCQVYARGRQQQRDQGADLLAAFPELQARSVWAVDGHQIEHACHALRDPKGRHVAPNTLYLLCLHSGLLCNLAAVQGDGQYHHEMPILRAALPEFLQQELPGRRRTRRPLIIADPAFVDHRFWHQQQQLREAGTLMIIRAKDNSAPVAIQARAFAAADPVNTGVTADAMVTFAGGAVLRRVRYTDPETGERYEFLTTDLDLRPGVIAWLYLLRWRIEKVFDTAKNKLEETKAWATGPVARRIQGHFLALSHNLLVLFRGLLDREFGIREEKLEHRRVKQLDQREEAAERKGGCLHPFHRLMPRIVQLSLQFIRCLRNQILAQRSFRQALAHLRAMLVAYL